MHKPDLRNKLPCAGIISILIILLSGCVNTASSGLDPVTLWRQADQQHDKALRGISELGQLRNDYTAITRLSSDSNLRGQAFVRLAELDLAVADFTTARQHLEQALRTGLDAGNRAKVLLVLGDTLERHLHSPVDAARTYRQAINEYPGTPEAALAELRLEALHYEP